MKHFRTCYKCCDCTQVVEYKAVPTIPTLPLSKRKYYCATHRRRITIRILFACLVTVFFYFYYTLPSIRVSKVAICGPVSSTESFVAIVGDVLATRVDGCSKNQNPRLQRFLTWDRPNGRLGNNIQQFEFALFLALRLKRGILLHPLIYNGEMFGTAFDIDAVARLLEPYGGIIRTQSLSSGDWRYDWMYPRKVQKVVDVNWDHVCDYYPSHPLLVLNGPDMFYLEELLAKTPAAKCTEVAGELQSVCAHGCPDTSGKTKDLDDFGHNTRPTLMPNNAVIQNAKQTLKLLRGWSPDGMVCTAHIRRYDCEESECDDRCGQIWVQHLQAQLRTHGCGLWFIFSDRPELIPTYTRDLPASTVVVVEKDLFPSHSLSESFLIATLITISGLSDVHLSVPFQTWERTERAVRARYRSTSSEDTSVSSHIIVQFPKEIKTCLCKGVC